MSESSVATGSLQGPCTCIPSETPRRGRLFSFRAGSFVFGFCFTKVDFSNMFHGLKSAGISESGLEEVPQKENVEEGLVHEGGVQSRVVHFCLKLQVSKWDPELGGVLFPILKFRAKKAGNIWAQTLRLASIAAKVHQRLQLRMKRLKNQH